MVRHNTVAFALSCLLGAPQLVSSHSWVERLNRISANGTFIEPAGYSNGWIGRETADGFNDPKFTHRIPNDGVSLCKQDLEVQQSDRFPLLTAAPGDFVALRYQENGHVTIPDNNVNKPLNRGTIYIYGTADPKPNDTIFDVHRQWTADGKGGDGRGRLLATRNYDDGQCYQENEHPISQQRISQFPHEPTQPMGGNVWCQSAIQLPGDLAQNSDYHVYWVWTWPTLKPEAAAASKNGQFADFPSDFKGDKRAVTSDDVTIAELYTSCSTIKVKGEKNVTAFDFPAKLDYNNNAIKEQLKNPFLVAVDGTDGPGGPGNSTQPTPTAAPAAGKVRQVTVTAEAMTLYSMLTVTLNPQVTPTPQNPGDGAAQPAVTPFLKGRHVRGRDSWVFNQRA
ncbi:hypothetical protein CSOJ01_00575 [Colletotrichum sojae]|uniref:DUF7492 domain-containing protein n=1 Tax=Colletotrichum sojae TaxID=2175907 RepID=A0A8H6JXQ9_9PEZI|nr:hypothetical protein CSOJ01_00575 [Colletotrichum sojae]